MSGNTGLLGYGRYADDLGRVGCPRAKTDMTPCVARDGASATDDDARCVGCGKHPATLLTELVRATTEPTETIRIYEDFLRELGIDTDQPQEAIFEEARRKISALVVAADPSVMENR